MGDHLRFPSNPQIHQTTIVLTGIRGDLNWSPLCRVSGTTIRLIVVVFPVLTCCCKNSNSNLFKWNHQIWLYLTHHLLLNQLENLEQEIDFWFFLNIHHSLIDLDQTEYRFVPNQPENGEFNLISVSLTRKRIRAFRHVVQSSFVFASSNYYWPK